VPRAASVDLELMVMGEVHTGTYSQLFCSREEDQKRNRLCSDNEAGGGDGIAER
jgi:hypothetical protein